MKSRKGRSVDDVQSRETAACRCSQFVTDRASIVRSVAHCEESSSTHGNKPPTIRTTPSSAAPGSLATKAAHRTNNSPPREPSRTRPRLSTWTPSGAPSGASHTTAPRAWTPSFTPARSSTSKATRSAYRCPPARNANPRAHHHARVRRSRAPPQRGQRRRRNPQDGRRHRRKATPCLGQPRAHRAARSRHRSESRSGRHQRRAARRRGGLHQRHRVRRAEPRPHRHHTRQQGDAPGVQRGRPARGDLQAPHELARFHSRPRAQNATRER